MHLDRETSRGVWRWNRYP